MNLLLVVPRIVSKTNDFYMFPLGIAFISAVLNEAGFNVITINLNHVDDPLEYMKNRIQSDKIDIVLTGGLTGQYGAIRSVIENSKLSKKSIINIVGGGIITSSPLYAMEALEFADYGVVGEGELTVCELIRALENDEEIFNVPGIVFHDGVKYVITKGKPKSIEIDKIPMPDYKGLGLEDLLKNIPNIVGMNEFNSFPIITSRGCPFRCTFCFHPSGQKYRQRSLDLVFKEIDYLIKEFDVKYLSIMDENFGHNINRVEVFCKRIKAYGLKWWAQFRVTDINEDLIYLLKESNCAAINFGVESADNRILKSMNKKITIENTNKALAKVYKAGIGISGNLIFGDKEETVETAKISLKWWQEHIHYGLQLSVVVTYPGTALFQYAVKEGLIKDPVQFIRDSCPVVKLSLMKDEEYAWMMEQILSMQRTALNFPNDIISIKVNYESAYIDLVGRCATCNRLNEWFQVRLFINESLICSYCGRRQYSPIPMSIINSISGNINILCNRYGTICFWGINSYFYALFEQLFINKDQVKIVDKSEIRLGVNVFGNQVESTEVLQDEDIKCVVVTVPQYYSSLASTIAAEFPQVEKILSIADLILDDIEIN